MSPGYPCLVDCVRGDSFNVRETRIQSCTLTQWLRALRVPYELPIPHWLASRFVGASVVSYVLEPQEGLRHLREPLL